MLIIFKKIITNFMGCCLKEEKENIILLTLQIKQKHLNKDIYFLDNVDYTDINGKKHFHDNLIELNNKNVDLYINNIKYDFKKYFTPDKEGEYSIKLKFKKKLKDCSFMFAGCKNIIKIDFKSFVTNEVIDMKYMFSGCTKMQSLDLSSFNTTKVTNMSGMLGEFNAAFFNEDQFKNIDVNNMPKNFDKILKGCRRLTNVNISSFDTSNVINMMFMFGYCQELTNLHLSNFNTKNVTNMMGMFNCCEKLISLDLSNFNTQKVSNMMSMFTKCQKIGELDLSSFNTSKVINMMGLFGHMTNLKKINLSSFNTKNVTNMLGMFNSCESLEFLDVSNFNTDKVSCMMNMFTNCKNLLNLDLSNFNIQNLEHQNCKNMFSGCTHYKKFNLGQLTKIDESILLSDEKNQ